MSGKAGDGVTTFTGGTGKMAGIEDGQKVRGRTVAFHPDGKGVRLEAIDYTLP